MRPHVLLVCLAVAACARHPERIAVAPPPPAPPPAPTPINAGLSPAAALWHLRAGLNVAALACPDPVMAAGYNRFLSGHAGALAAADAGYQAEYAMGGGDWRDRYDDDQTRLYNFWGDARGRSGLCAAAGEALGAVAAADAALPAVVAAELARLDRAFAPPRLEVDARVLTGPGRVMVALR